MPTEVTPENLSLARQIKTILDAAGQLKMVMDAADQAQAAGITTKMNVKTTANTARNTIITQITTFAATLNMTVRLNTLTGQYIVVDNP